MSASQDRYFNQGMAARFARNIYASQKGRVRLKMLRRLMRAELPLDRPLRVLDVGGGLGQIACWLAAQGHQVTLAEPAQEMLDYAQRRLTRYPIRVLPLALQDLQGVLEEEAPFDLVVCHAVLEWLQDPDQAVERLKSWVAPGGYLSLMYFNAEALFLANVLRGNWQRALEKDLRGQGKGKRLTPISPLPPTAYQAWLADWQCAPPAGIRVFSDYLRLKLPPEATQERLLALEAGYCQQEPWWRLGRYILIQAQKPAARG